MTLPSRALLPVSIFAVLTLRRAVRSLFRRINGSPGERPAAFAAIGPLPLIAVCGLVGVVAYVGIGGYLSGHARSSASEPDDRQTARQLVATLINGDRNGFDKLLYPDDSWRFTGNNADEFGLYAAALKPCSGVNLEYSKNTPLQVPPLTSPPPTYRTPTFLENSPAHVSTGRSLVPIETSRRSPFSKYATTAACW